MVTVGIRGATLLVLLGMVAVVRAAKDWTGAGLGEYVSSTKMHTQKWQDECIWDKVRICFLQHKYAGQRTLSSFKMLASNCPEKSLLAQGRLFSNFKHNCTEATFLTSEPTHI